ncbi:MAG: MurR/RpiR family transcriptional regulator [Clostridia bacterium]|nr:MurR/RpiR family transcriptional regulator [Clostridia bacterium]
MSDALQLIEAGLSSGSKAQKKIGKYLLENYATAAGMTAAKLAATVGTSESTVVRYAADLGYRGYPELQAALKESIRGTLTSLQRMELSGTATGGEAFYRSMRADMENIKKTLAETDVHIFDLVAEKLIAARRIYIIGARSATSLAMFLEFYLTQLFDDVRLVQTVAGGEVFDRMLSVNEEDVVIGISFPRYSRRTLDALDFSKKKGAYVVGITDSDYSPLASLADAAVYAHNENDCFVDSLVAPMAVLNAIIAAVTAKRPEESVARLSEMEQIWDEYNVYKTNK